VTNPTALAVAHRQPGRHAGKPSPVPGWRVLARRARRHIRSRLAHRDTVLSSRDVDTIAAFIAWNQPARLARILRGAAELANTGPAGRAAALELLCTLNDGFHSIRLTRAAKASGWYYTPVAGGR
jgi:hypothetical protein